MADGADETRNDGHERVLPRFPTVLHLDEEGGKVESRGVAGRRSRADETQRGGTRGMLAQESRDRSPPSAGLRSLVLPSVFFLLR